MIRELFSNAKSSVMAAGFMIPKAEHRWIHSTGSSTIAINTLGACSDANADGDVYDGINKADATGTLADITAWVDHRFVHKAHLRSCYHYRFPDGIQSRVLEGVGLPNIASSIAVPTLTVTKGGCSFRTNEIDCIAVHE